MVIASLAIMQLATGVYLDYRYDRSVVRSLLIAPLYPLGYWVLMSLVTVRSTLPALLARTRPPTARWHTVRERAVEPAAA
jgi:hypothetical protein